MQSYLVATMDTSMVAPASREEDMCLPVSWTPCVARGHCVRTRVCCCCLLYERMYTYVYVNLCYFMFVSIYTCVYI
jgi:hypothetical protein